MKSKSVILSLLGFILLGLGLGLGLGLPSPQAAAANIQESQGEIQLVLASSRVHRRYGYATQQLSFLFYTSQVQEVQEVQVRGLDQKNRPFHLTAKIKEKLPSGGLLWEALQDQSQYGDDHVMDLKFWGEGNNLRSDGPYELKSNDGPLLGKNYPLYLGRVSYSPEKKEVTGEIPLKNLAYRKEVTVVYSWDQWQTVQTQPAHYEPSHVYGFSYVPSPNRQGVEYWTFSLKAPSSLPEGATLQMAIRYDVDGKTFWDNQWGKNHSLSIP